MSEETATARIRELERTLQEAENEIADLRGLVTLLRARLRDHGRTSGLGGLESRTAADSTVRREEIVPGDGCPHVCPPQSRA